MASFDFTPDDIVRLLQSMALSRAKGAFLPGRALDLERMPSAAQAELARTAVLFFGLPAPLTETLPQCRQWEHWGGAVQDALPDSSGLLAFSTSGSSGVPDLHRFTPEDLREELNSLLPHFSDRQRTLSVMPLHHVFGFVFALLLPRQLGVPALHLPPLPTADFFANLRPGDLLLAFPIFWAALLRMIVHAPARELPKNLYGVSSAAPCPPETVEGLLTSSANAGSGLLARMTEIYGATEFGAVGIRHHCRDPYTLLPHWHRQKLDEDGNGAGKHGPSWGIRRDKGPATAIPDVLEWTGERRFVPVKRRDKAVQVGGVNVFPLEIAEILRAHPKVTDCAVRLMRPDEGGRLKAFVVPEKAEDLFRPQRLSRELKAWLSRRLGPEARPKKIRIGQTLPLSPSGKLADWNCHDEAARAETVEDACRNAK